MSKGYIQNVENDLLRAYSAHPNKIASVFSWYMLEEGTRLPQSVKDKLLESKVKYGEDDKTWRNIVSNLIDYHQKQKFKAHNLISKSIHIFCQAAKQKANGDKELLQEIEHYRDCVFEWLKQGLENGQLDIFEKDRLLLQRQSLINKLHKIESGNGGKVDNRIKTEQSSESVRNINIQNFKGILGNVQAENVQSEDHSSVFKYDGLKKKSFVRSLLKIIAAIVTFLAALLTCLYYLGWIKL